jgi:hypothetical protein
VNGILSDFDLEFDDFRAEPLKAHQCGGVASPNMVLSLTEAAGMSFDIFFLQKR